MKVLDPGHKFALDLLDFGENAVTSLTFVKRIGEKFPGNEPPAYPGTNLQEAYRAEIARHKYLDAQDPCPENQWCIRNLRNNIRFLEERAARRHGRKPDWRLYESNGLETNDQIEFLPTCKKCGHIGCEGRRHHGQD